MVYTEKGIYSNTVVAHNFLVYLHLFFINLFINGETFSKHFFTTWPGFLSSFINLFNRVNNTKYVSRWKYINITTLTKYQKLLNCERGFNVTFRKPTSFQSNV